MADDSAQWVTGFLTSGSYCLFRRRLAGTAWCNPDSVVCGGGASIAEGRLKNGVGRYRMNRITTPHEADICLPTRQSIRIDARQGRRLYLWTRFANFPLSADAGIRLQMPV